MTGMTCFYCSPGSFSAAPARWLFMLACWWAHVLTVKLTKRRSVVKANKKSSVHSMTRRVTAIAFFMAILIAALSPTSLLAQTAVTYTWTAPTTGSPVAHYVVQAAIDGGPFVTVANVIPNTYTLSADAEKEYIIRVAGVDSLDRQGPWSEESDPFIDAGAPGQPGKPWVESIVLGAIGGIMGGLIVGLLFGLFRKS